ncbi:universal stress protein [Pseudomarimonas arenosa]|uniref:Universal stress protein n=1 Tax=Pseudomarimonas arenosa TaxID=2774145 RepID=A0AAW3ZJJ9_9GAMM|nr:universal stress protein [Pseudomarimonas arenosa]MBD8526171.1 universal stress protein [Pseudomarimonas arenosa]
MKFLVAIDGSDTSIHAFERAVSLSRQWGGEHHFLLLNVQQPIPHADAFGLTVGMDGPLLQQIGERELQRANALAQELGLNYEARTEIGPAAHRLAEIADETNADMIVLGSKGRSNLANVLVGSVASRVPNYTKRPVLLIPPA